MSTTTRKRGLSVEKLQGVSPETPTAEEPKRPPKSRWPNLQVVIKPEARKQLRILAAELDVKQQDLVAEGINLVFKHYGKAPIA